MALFYTATFRGTVVEQKWACSTHWRVSSGAGSHSERLICETLAKGLLEGYDAFYKGLVTGNTVLTKIVAQAYGDAEGFYEQPAASIGSLSGAICPPFTAKGFRQFRTNSNFRTSTHRFPEVREDNQTNGSWVFDGSVTNEGITAWSDVLGNPHEFEVPDDITVITFQPVLIRTQYTTVTHDPETKTVTYLNPPEISDVAEAAFYGVTSQVSRKFILPT